MERTFAAVCLHFDFWQLFGKLIWYRIFMFLNHIIISFQTFDVSLLHDGLQCPEGGFNRTWLSVDNAFHINSSDDSDCVNATNFLLGNDRLVVKYYSYILHICLTATLIICFFTAIYIIHIRNLLCIILFLHYLVVKYFIFKV